MWPHLSRAQGLVFSFENDALYFPAPTDRYYTNGLRLQHWLKPSENIQWNVALQHRMYNGLKNTDPTPIPGDRPYTSTLLLRAERIQWSEVKGTQLSLGSSVGVMGAEAQGGELQNGIHALLENSTEAYGWDRQLRSMPIVQIEAERQHIIGNDFWALAGRYGTDVGTILTSVHGGATAYIGMVDNPLSPRTQDQTYVRAKIGMQASAVLYDATLLGSPFINDPQAIDRELMNIGRLHGQVGLESQIKGLSIAIEMHWLSPEVQGLDHHRYGAVRLGCFF